MIVVWNSNNGMPHITIPQPSGVIAVDFSPDASLLATVSKDFPQTFALWDWMNDAEMPIFIEPMPAKDLQTHCRFNPFDPHEIVTNGSKKSFSGVGRTVANYTAL